MVTGPDGVLRVQAFHWGLIPSWAKDRKIGAKMINARSETLAEKPAFKGLLAKKRCLIPMDGFYEWKAGAADGPVNAKGKPLKQPMFIHRIDGEPLAVAGLWTAWKDPEAGSRWLQSATVVTTSANETMQAVHDRMPVIVPASRWKEWLDPDNHDIAALSELFTERNDGILTMHPGVDRRQQRPQQRRRPDRSGLTDLRSTRVRSIGVSQDGRWARIAAAAASRSAGSTWAAALAKLSSDIADVGIT